MNKKIRVVVVQPDKAIPEVKEILSSLEAQQDIVGGYIEAFSYEGMSIICNEEGKLNGMPFNRPVYDDAGKMVDIIVGTFFITAYDEEGSGRDLTDEEIKHAFSVFTMTKAKTERYAEGLRGLGYEVNIL